MDTQKKTAPFLNKVIHGNCLEKLKAFPNECVDLIFADPPYNLQLQNELFRPDETKVQGVHDSWDQFSSFKEYDRFSLAWLKLCKKVLKPTGTLWLIGSYHNIFRLGTILQNLGFWILNDIVWIKSNPTPNFKGTRFNNAHETLIWASKSRSSQFTFNYKTMKCFNDDKQMRSDWYIPICSGKERLKDSKGQKIHSTQKPEELLKRVLLSSSKAGDVVLDPFFGSGTTGAIAKKLNRHFIGIEKEKTYVNHARKRLKHIIPYNKKWTVQLQDVPKPKVPFGQLVENCFIKAGETLYSKDKKHSAVVMADGTLKNGKYKGSIHSMSAHIMGKKNYNGWTFWYQKTGKRLVSIDHAREKYHTVKKDLENTETV